MLVWMVGTPVTVTERTKACTDFTRSEAEIVDRGFESHSGRGCLAFVCVRFSVFVYK
jgi:hypothetical protein